jgi:ketosteroid isomerase-like protein
MKQRIGALIVLGLALAGRPMSGAEAGAASVDIAWREAMLANDVDKVVACYASDAVLWMPGARASHGHDAIRAAYEAFFSANNVKDVVISDTHYKESGNVSAGWGSIVMTIVPRAGGPQVVMKGRYTEVCAQDGKRWVYVADHASADPEPSAVPAK